jgi:hypothetical protein
VRNVQATSAVAVIFVAAVTPGNAQERPLDSNLLQSQPSWTLTAPSAGSQLLSPNKATDQKDFPRDKNGQIIRDASGKPVPWVKGTPMDSYTDDDEEPKTRLQSK